MKNLLRTMRSLASTAGDQRPGNGSPSTMANTALMRRLKRQAVQTSYCERMLRRTSNKEL
jgi:hypothetical protein